MDNLGGGLPLKVTRLATIDSNETESDRAIRRAIHPFFERVFTHISELKTKTDTMDLETSQRLKSIEDQLNAIINTLATMQPNEKNNKSLAEIIKDKSIFGMPVLHVTIRDLIYCIIGGTYLFGKFHHWWP